MGKAMHSTCLLYGPSKIHMMHFVEKQLTTTNFCWFTKHLYRVPLNHCEIDNQHNSFIVFLKMLYNCYTVDIAVIRALNGQLALDFISLNNALFDIISV